MNMSGGKKSSTFMVISWAVTILFLFLVFKVLTGFIGGATPSDSGSSGFFGSPFSASTNSTGSYETNDTPSIVLLTIEGGIGASLAEKVYDAYEALAEDDNVLGVILDVNSPGGGVTSSERVRVAGIRFAEEKPLYAAIYQLGASGAYMSSVAAEKIYAYPTSLVGSIGVIAESTEFVELLRKIGINSTIIKSGKFKATGYSTHELTQEEIDNQQELIDNLFAKFVDDVATGRNMTTEQVRALAEGQVFTGQQSIENGLIDELGDYNDAFEAMKASLNLTEEEMDEVQLIKYSYVETKNLPSIFGAVKGVSELVEGLNSLLSSSSQTDYEYRLP